MGKVIVLVLMMGCDVSTSSDTAPSDESGEEGLERTAFSCGALTCQPDEYCMFGSNPVMSPDTADVPDVLYSCERIPAECVDTPSCGCLEVEVDPAVVGGCEAGCEERDGGLFCETEMS
ncbi:MAG: hypothetical protein AAFV53_33845 [Myxococcota bacterium]